MKTTKINQQKTSDKVWINEAGQEVPVNRLTKHEKDVERATAGLAKRALLVQDQIADLKRVIHDTCLKLYTSFLAEYNVEKVGKGKGGMTFFNFDRSIKIELQAKEPLSFDDNTIGLAKAKLEELLEDGLQSAKDFVKPLVMDAFNNSKGKLDPKQVLGLRRHKDRIKDARYSEACDLIDKAIRRSATKQYYKIWIKDAAGQYQDVQLNFATLSLED